MKLVEQSFEIIPQEAGIEGIYKQIEKAGRTCYKSEDKITENSAKKFVDMLTTNCHGAMLEHGTVYFKIPTNIDTAGNFLDEVSTWTKCKLVESSEGNWWAITTNFRVMIEHFAPEYIEELIEKYLCEPTEYHEKRITVKFTTDQGVLREFTRHRTMSFACESTRYCNYSKDKFGKEITYIIPCWLKDFPEGNYLSPVFDDDSLEICSKFKEMYPEITSFVKSLADSEFNYLWLLDQGWKPQEARNVLPLATKCDLVMTGFVSDWKHFFELRCDSAAHPQAKELAIPLQDWFKENNLID